MFFVFNIITLTISLFKNLISCIILKTSLELLIATLFEFTGFPILVVNSQTAFICIAFTFPIPFISVSCVSEISLRKFKSCSFPKLIIFLAKSTADSSFVPVLIIIANSSEFDKL